MARRKREREPRFGEPGGPVLPPTPDFLTSKALVVAAVLVGGLIVGGIVTAPNPPERLLPSPATAPPEGSTPAAGTPPRQP